MNHLGSNAKDAVDRAIASFAAGVAHLWLFELLRPDDEVARFSALLSDDERSRAARFTFPGLRERFIAGRGLMRTILGSYLDVAPAEIGFCYNGYGKPALATPAGTPVAFNLSHSGDLALLGVTHGREIGVDIERHRPEIDCEQLAKHFFAPAEIEALGAAPAELRRAAFFACWTRKEAYIKALGRGLSTPLDGFAVSLDPAAAPALLSVDDAPQEVGRWLMTSLTPGEGYTAAACVELPVREVHQFHWA